MLFRKVGYSHSYCTWHFSTKAFLMPSRYNHVSDIIPRKSTYRFCIHPFIHLLHTSFLAFVQIHLPFLWVSNFPTNFNPSCPASKASRKVSNLTLRKNQIFLYMASKYLSVIYSFNDLLALNNRPDMHHSQGEMKFATQISPLLNFVIFQLFNCGPWSK